MAKIVSISGPIVNVRLEGERVRIQDVAYVGVSGLVGEVIERDPEVAVIQVYEETEGLKLGEGVAFTGEMLSALLGPGLLGSIYDGIQRPLEQVGTRMQKGLRLEPLDRDREWHFSPSVNAGDRVEAGECIGSVKDESGFEYRILVPPDREGVASAVAEAGNYSLDDTVLELENGERFSMLQRWPVRIPRPFEKRILSSKPMITGQRIIDFLFPISEGGSASIPGGFGTGKTILQQTLAKWSDADIIVYIDCRSSPSLKTPRAGNG